MRRAAFVLPLLLALGAWTAGQDAAPFFVVTKSFATSDACAFCHSNAERGGALRDAAGRGVAPFDLWRGTMMANAARDPFFRAAVAAEVAADPQRKDEIEAKCLACHAPMAAVEISRRGALIGMDLFRIDTSWAAAAKDGVSCSLCHQIAAENLGRPGSFSGGFEINDAREIYGPHEDPYTLPMKNALGYWPTEGRHVLKSALCGTCHTLFVGDGFPEQTPYLEWRNSAFSDEGEPGPEARTCQDCHVPTASEGGAPIRTRLARDEEGADFQQIEARTPIGRHLFVGGNTLLPAILRDHAEELAVAAPRAAFDATIAAARDQLRERTAQLTIGEVFLQDQFTVRVSNLAGHKLPTAHPSRRAWLRVRVRDADTGALLFASGEHDERGRILGADGEPLPSELAGGPVLPHVDEIREPGRVQVYEAVMADAAGRPTVTAMHAARYAKDNRLLPRGWRGDGPHADATAPVGVGGDEDFGAGGDTVTYRFERPDDTAAVVIEVDLLYQAIAPRFAAELFRYEAADVQTFRRMYEAADVRPELAARARAISGR